MNWRSVTSLLIAGAAVAGVIGVGLILYLPTETTAEAAMIPAEVQAVEFTSDTGEPIRLSDFNGSYTMLAFGYTFCPDVCPLTLSDFRRIRQDLPENRRDDVNFVFVSVDGARDEPDVLHHYITRFHPAFIGMTTEDDRELDQLAAAFNVTYSRRQVEGSAVDYVCDHTAITFLIDPEGRIVRSYPFRTLPEDIATEIRGLL